MENEKASSRGRAESSALFLALELAGSPPVSSLEHGLAVSVASTAYQAEQVQDSSLSCLSLI